MNLEKAVGKYRRVRPTQSLYFFDDELAALDAAVRELMVWAAEAVQAPWCSEACREVKAEIDRLFPKQGGNG